jgi:flagellar hook-length control protein FliK
MPGAAAAAARRSEAPAPIVPFADAASTGGHGDAQDASSQEQHGGSASARLAAAVASVSEVPASAAHHEAAPAFTIPGASAAPAAAAADVPAVADAAAVASDSSIAPDNLDRLVQAMQVNTRAGVMEATVRLRPEYLGDVTINHKVEGRGVSAVVHAETPAVRQWLESNEQTIRSGLAEHGLELERFVVDPNGQQNAQQRDAQQDAQEQRRAWRRRQAITAAQRFEITV